MSPGRKRRSAPAFLGRINDSSFQAEAEVLIHAEAQIGFALGLKQIVKSAHLGFIFRALTNLDGRALTQLRVAGIAVAPRSELGPDTRRFGFIFRTAAVTARRFRFERQVRETHTAGL